VNFMWEDQIITDILQEETKTFTQAVTEYQTKILAPSTITKVSFM
jgi:hypothetical protein